MIEHPGGCGVQPAAAVNCAALEAPRARCCEPQGGRRWWRRRRRRRRRRRGARAGRGGAGLRPRPPAAIFAGRARRSAAPRVRPLRSLRQTALRRSSGSTVLLLPSCSGSRPVSHLHRGGAPGSLRCWKQKWPTVRLVHPTAGAPALRWSTGSCSRNVHRLRSSADGPFIGPGIAGTVQPAGRSGGARAGAGAGAGAPPSSRPRGRVRAPTLSVKTTTGLPAGESSPCRAARDYVCSFNRRMGLLSSHRRNVRRRI